MITQENINYQNKIRENVEDIIHSTTIDLPNNIQSYILDNVFSDAEYDLKAVHELSAKACQDDEALRVISGFITDTFFDPNTFGNSLIYGSEKLKFYEDHEQTLITKINELLDYHGEDFMNFINGISKQLKQEICNLDNIKCLIVDFVICDEAYKIYEAIEMSQGKSPTKFPIGSGVIL